MKVEYKVYENRLKEIGKTQLFSKELEDMTVYRIARDPDSPNDKLILIGTKWGEEKERTDLPLNNNAVSRYDPAIEKYGSLIITVFGDDIQMYSPSTTTFPVLARHNDQIVGVPLGQVLSVRREFGRLRNGFRIDLYIYKVSPLYYIGSIEVSEQ
jgi:hypothetical protein